MMARTFPPEDTQKFYDTMRDMVTQGGCVSVKDASDRAFTHLRQRGGEWQDKPYGPHTAKQLLAGFSDEQNAELHSLLGIQVPEKMRGSAPQGRTNIFDRKPELRERFLTRVAEGATRPQLSIEFDLLPEHLPLALTIAVRKQGQGTFGGTSEQLLQEKIEQVATQRPEWANLATLHIQPAERITRDKENWLGIVTPMTQTANGAQITLPEWQSSVTDEERQQIQRLKHENDKKNGVSALDTDNLYSGGTEGPKAGFSQRVAESLIGNGSKVINR